MEFIVLSSTRHVPHLMDDLIDLLKPGLLRDVAVHPDSGLEGEVLPHSQRADEEIVLLHVGREGCEAGGGHQPLIGQPQAGHLQPLQVPEGRVHLIIYCN